jgi:uncharacterized membrane protein HdeD (DUF308 family)
MPHGTVAQQAPFVRNPSHTGTTVLTLVGIVVVIIGFVLRLNPLLVVTMVLASDYAAVSNAALAEGLSET